MKHNIDIKGRIVPNDYAWYFDYTGEDYTTPKMVSDVLAQASAGDEIAVYINSPGGSIDAGSEIYSMIREATADKNVKIYVTGQACSMASVIACAGYCLMAPTALMMVHCVSSGVIGNHNDMEKMAETLRAADHALVTAYVAKTGKTEEEALELMENETWFTAKEAKAIGLVDEIMFDEALPMVASSGFMLPTEEQMQEARRAIRQKLIDSVASAHDNVSC